MSLVPFASDTLPTESHNPWALGATIDCISSRMLLVARKGEAGGALGADCAGCAWHPADMTATASTAPTPHRRMNLTQSIPRSEVRQHAPAVEDREPAEE